MKMYRLTERVVVTREYVIPAESEDDALDKMNSGDFEPREAEEENLEGVSVEVVRLRNQGTT